MTTRQDMEAVLEAVLFVANEPVARERLLEVFVERERDEAAEALEAVIGRYRETPARGFQIDEVAGGLRLVSRPDLHGYLRRFFELSGRNKLSMAALETLAIISYRQPVTGPEIQELRGVSSAGVIKTLLERRLIRIAGRKEVVGKPFLYATTREFLMHFGLKTLKELPPLEQFEELYGGDAEGETDGETLDGEDHEEVVLQEASAIEEAEAEAAERQEAAEDEAAEMAQAEAEGLEADDSVADEPELPEDPEPGEDGDAGTGEAEEEESEPLDDERPEEGEEPAS